MAQPPHPAPPKPAVPPPPPPGNLVPAGAPPAKTSQAKLEGYGPTIGVEGKPIDDGERDPGTIAEEQRLRSAEIEKEGVEAWKAKHDTRTEEQKRQLAVEGVQKRIEDHKAS